MTSKYTTQDVKLSILIATTSSRKQMFDLLFEELNKQAKDFKVEVLFDATGKEMSIGNKRQKLLERAQGEYIVFFDDDDWPIDNYVQSIVEVLDGEIDCVGFKILMTTNGSNKQICEHSLKHSKWLTLSSGPIAYVRNVTHFNPVRRSLALQVGFKDIRFGEDKEYSDRVSLLCKKEKYLDVPYIFHYRFSTKEEHNSKYGIK